MKPLIGKPFTYTQMLKSICQCVKTAIDIIVQKVVKEEIKNTPEVDLDNYNEVSKLPVCGDGSWRKRGFSSLFGTSSAIGYYRVGHRTF